MNIFRLRKCSFKIIRLIGSQLFVIVLIFSFINSQIMVNVITEYGFDNQILLSNNIAENNFTTERTNWNLTQIGNYDNWDLQEFCFSSDYLFFMHYNGVRVINFSNPLNPIQIGICSFMFSSPYDIKFHNNYLYIADADLGLIVFNVTDVTSPTHVTTFKDNVNAKYNAVFIVGSFAYIADLDYGLRILVINSLPSITQIGSLYLGELENVREGFWVTGNHVYLGGYNWEIDIIDVSNPVHPILRCNYTDSYWTYSVCVIGNTMYYTNYYGFYAVDVTDKTNPQVRDEFGTSFPWTFDSFVINGTEAFLIETREHQYDLNILDISNPDDIARICTYDTETDNEAIVVVKNDLIFVYCWDTGLEIIGFDFDNDGLADKLETDIYGTNPFNSDTDADSMPDGFEIEYSLDPFVDDADDDEDHDELTNLEEFIYNTNPNEADSDSDGLNDSDEIFIYFTDPNREDTDSDNIIDGQEVLLYGSNPLKSDSDNDQISDYDEIFTHLTDPVNNDTDSDLLSDYEEIFEYGTDPLVQDTDQDGFTDFEEIQEGTDPLDSEDNPNKYVFVYIIIFGVGFPILTGLIIAVAAYMKKQQSVEK